MAWILRLTERAKMGGAVNGKRLYQRHCAACHLDDLSGAPPNFPALNDLSIDAGGLVSLVRGGVGRMPAFPNLSDAAVRSVATFVLEGEVGEAIVAAPSGQPPDVPFTHDGYNRFLDPDGYPAISPPWGTLNSVNLDTGEIGWKVRLGEYPELGDAGIPTTGTENYGGPVVTGRWPAIHRRYCTGPEVSGVRQVDRRTPVGDDPACRWQCDPSGLRGRRSPVRCNRRWRR